MTMKRCYYCPEHPGFIQDGDKFAEKQPDGSWKCGECVSTDIRRRMVKVLGSNHPKTREFVRKEQKRVEHWNQFSKIVNQGSGTNV